MSRRPEIYAAIVDYGMGNLFSVQQACTHVDLHSVITSDKKMILDAGAVILPGVGSFGDAMHSLRQLDLIGVLQGVAAAPQPLIGICLGMQLLMDEGYEFGWHKGLGIVPGEVVRFKDPREKSGRILKVPQVGWNQVHKPGTVTRQQWDDSLLNGVLDGEYMYFVHSYYVIPRIQTKMLSVSRYGDLEFCSSLQSGNNFGCQFHPERSGPGGLSIYKNLCRHLSITVKGA